MKKASEYHKRSQECRQLAAQAGKSEYKAALIKMAETWETLARDREAWLARRRRIDILSKPLRAGPR